MAKNNEAKKYYLSPAAIARLRAESARSAYPMSVIIDMLILKHLPSLTPPTAQEMAVGMAVREVSGTGEARVVPTREFLAKEDEQPKPKERFKIDL